MADEKNEKDRAKQIVEGIKKIVEAELSGEGYRVGEVGGSAQQVLRALREERRLTREKLERAASV